MTLALPQIPGISWPVDVDFGMFDTTIETSVSGRQNRYINRVQSRRRYTLAIDGLDQNGVYPGLGTNSAAALWGFYCACYGGGLAFKFWDPADHTATAAQFGVGDGATTAFQLTRLNSSSSPAWAENVLAPFVPSAPTLIPNDASPNLSSANVFAPNNVLLNSATLSTQTVTAGAGSWVLSFSGTGSVTLSGAATGTLAGTGVGTRVSLAVTSSGGSVTATVSGSVTSAQFERTTLTTPGVYAATLGSPYYGAPYITAASSLVDPSLYTVDANTGVVTFGSAPASGAALVWTGNFSWWCNWDDDSLALSNLMSSLWEGQKISFTTRVF